MRKDARIRAIEELLSSEKVSRKNRVIESLGIDMLTMHMNAECLECKRCIAHKGQCYGRLGAVPCMAYHNIQLATI